MLLAGQVGEFYKDLGDERMVSALALVHQRFRPIPSRPGTSTHPFRMIALMARSAHAAQGNVNWMAAP